MFLRYFYMSRRRARSHSISNYRCLERPDIADNMKIITVFLQVIYLEYLWNRIKHDVRVTLLTKKTRESWDPKGVRAHFMDN